VHAISSRVTWLRSVAVAAVLSSAASPAAQGVGRIVGKIDGISQDGEQYFVSGWACQQGQKASILVHVFADDAKHSFVIAGKANLESDGSVGQACQDRQGGKHRFFISLPAGHGRERSFFVNGIRVVDGVANDAIAGSGTPLARLPGVQVPGPALPPLQGSHRGLAVHPRVFTTGAELKDLASRINRPGSYSMQRFGQLADQIARDLAARNDWDATYAGCNFGAYQYAFSHEPQDGHEAATHALLKLDAGTIAPAGAAVVASRLALYAALIKLGAAAPAGAPSADQAAGLAKRILLAWADRGFKDANGRFRAPSETCDDADKIALAHAAGIPLVLGRGVVYSVHARMWRRLQRSRRQERPTRFRPTPFFSENGGTSSFLSRNAFSAGNTVARSARSRFRCMQRRRRNLVRQAFRNGMKGTRSRRVTRGSSSLIAALKWSVASCAAHPASLT
jgi:hypothetical protein